MTWQIWAISGGAIALMFALAGFGPALLAGMHRRPRPPAHRRPRDNHPQTTREDWLNDTGSFSLDDELKHRGARALRNRGPLRPFPGDEGATVIEGPWGELELQPCCGQALAYCYCADRAAPGPAPGEYLPAPELDEGTDQDAFGLCGCGCLCWDGADGPDNICSRCRGGDHAPRAADDDDPTWVTRLRAELDEDQAPELADRVAAVAAEHPPETLGETYAAEFGHEIGIGYGQAAFGDCVHDAYGNCLRYPESCPKNAPELVLAEEAHAAQLREQDADAQAFIAGKWAEFAELRRSLAGPAR